MAKFLRNYETNAVTETFDDQLYNFITGEKISFDFVLYF